jgi:hypothetical protein
VIWNRRLIKTENGTLGLAGQKVKPGDLVCILFGCTVPVILRQCSRPKRQTEMDEEDIQDRYESMKAVILRCEEACFRKVRYRRKLNQLRGKSQELEEDWKREIKEETMEINRQMKAWKEKEEAAKEEKTKEEAEKEKRKKDAERRRKSRKTKERVEAAHPERSRDRPGSALDNRRSATFAGTTSGEVNGLQDHDKANGEPETSDGSNDSGVDAKGEDKKREKAEAEPQKEKIETKDEDSRLFYTFLGEAYIHGMMDGEAVRHHITEGSPDKLFELR